MPVPLAPEKFRDPTITARGQPRATVSLARLATLWVNTGTVCNLTCPSCYIGSSPTNHRLVRLRADEVVRFVDEGEAMGLEEVGFTGGEPFLNPDLTRMLSDVLGRGLRALVLTNATLPLERRLEEVVALARAHGERLVLRVSLDHFDAARHDAERGPGTFDRAVGNLARLINAGVRCTVASRALYGDVPTLRAGFAPVLGPLGLDAADPAQLVVFPQMDEAADVPEITTACWGILDKSPDSVMCASSRMVVRREGAMEPVVLACTLIAYDEAFELGTSLAASKGPVPLNHPHCARFCVLGGASCTA